MAALQNVRFPLPESTLRQSRLDYAHSPLLPFFSERGNLDNPYKLRACQAAFKVFSTQLFFIQTITREELRPFVAEFRRANPLTQVYPTIRLQIKASKPFFITYASIFQCAREELEGPLLAYDIPAELLHSRQLPLSYTIAKIIQSGRHHPINEEATLVKNILFVLSTVNNQRYSSIALQQFASWVTFNLFEMPNKPLPEPYIFPVKFILKYRRRGVTDQSEPYTTFLKALKDQYEDSKEPSNKEGVVDVKGSFDVLWNMGEMLYAHNETTLNHPTFSSFSKLLGESAKVLPWLSHKQMLFSLKAFMTDRPEYRREGLPLEEDVEDAYKTWWFNPQARGVRRTPYQFAIEWALSEWLIDHNLWHLGQEKVFKLIAKVMRRDYPHYSFDPAYTQRRILELFKVKSANVSESPLSKEVVASHPNSDSL